MKQPSDSKAKAKAKESAHELDEEALTRADALLRRMLEAPPKPHDAMTAKPAKKRAKKPRK